MAQTPLLGIHTDWLHDLIIGLILLQVFFQKIKKKSKAFGKSLGLDPDRCYNDYKIMAKHESARSDGVQAIGIMTPSGDHFKIAKEFIKNNVHIICDKPLTSKSRRRSSIRKTCS